MTQKNILLKGITALLCSITLGLNAQETHEAKTEIMAYAKSDIDPISSIHKTLSYKTVKNATSSNNSIGGETISSELAHSLIVQAEKELNIEAWMLSSFETSDTNNYLRTETEEDIELELWMTNLSYWESNSQNDSKQ